MVSERWSLDDWDHEHVGDKEEENEEYIVEVIREEQRDPVCIVGNFMFAQT